MGFVCNHIPFIKNNQSTITNVVMGLVGILGGNAAAGATGILGNLVTVGEVGTGVVGSVVALLAGKLFGNKAA